MKLYRIKIYPRSSYITPWQSDTLMGSLCWVILQIYGESALQEFLNCCLEGDYPFAVSDGFPGDLLPRPLFDLDHKAVEQVDRQEAMNHFAAFKRARKVQYVDLQEFNSITSGKRVDLSPRGPVEASVATLHNSVSRFSGSTIDGSLFEEQERFGREDYMSLYAWIADSWLEKFTELIYGLSRKGYGRRSSVGKGAFDVESPELFGGFEKQHETNAVVMFSNYVPAAQDPQVGRYKAFIKYGKLGSEYTYLENPFKKPVMMFKPGSVFWDENPRAVYGRTIPDVSLEKKEVVHFGCSVAIPAYFDNSGL